MADTLNLQLTDQLRRHVETRVKEGRDGRPYMNPSEYIRDLIQAAMKEDQAGQRAHQAGSV